MADICTTEKNSITNPAPTAQSGQACKAADLTDPANSKLAQTAQENCGHPSTKAVLPDVSWVSPKLESRLKKK
jgi:hypothetical protein